MYKIKIKDDIIWSVAYGDTSILYRQIGEKDEVYFKGSKLEVDKLINALNLVDYINIIQEYEEPLQIASTDEINNGIDNKKYITPKNLSNSLYRNIYIQETEPIKPKEGDLWITIT